MKKAIVFGAGISGRGSEKMLNKLGYNVVVIDDKVGLSSEIGMEIIKNEKIDIFVKSPGVPYTEFVKKTKEKSIEIIDDIELAYRYKEDNKIKGKIIAITGTNGKTTITSKLQEFLETMGYKVKVCGNIGFSFSETILENQELDFYVLELSSYQLENIKKFKADIAIVVNLAPDHLNRYKNVDDYYNTKFRIAMNQDKQDYLIINSNCKESKKRVQKCKGKILYVGIEKKISTQKAWSESGFLMYENEKILDEELVTLRGKHNLENMLFIVCIAKILKISNESIRNFLYSTKPLEHRMENFHFWGKSIFINDSKGTNIESTILAIEAYKNPILICGGSNKNLDLTPLVKSITKKVKKVYLIGEIADELEKKLLNEGYRKECISNLKELKKVINDLKQTLDKNEKNTILLSPATASFDQFKNFEERGRIFKEMIITNF